MGTQRSGGQLFRYRGDVHLSRERCEGHTAARPDSGRRASGRFARTDGWSGEFGERGAWATWPGRALKRGVYSFQRKTTGAASDSEIEADSERIIPAANGILRVGPGEGLHGARVRSRSKTKWKLEGLRIN